jgi:hypothetical protein
VALLLTLLSLAFHWPSLLFPSLYIFSPMDIVGRQVEFAGSPTDEPSNRLLIDPILQFQPWDLWIQQELAAGRFPFWTSLSGAGAPFAANGQSRLFDPLHLFFLQFPLPWAWSAESFVRFIFAGFGTYLLARSLYLGPFARIFCPLAINLTGYFTLWRLYPLVATGAIFPWLLWSFLRLNQRFSASRWAASSLLTAWIIAAGNIQVAAVAILITCLSLLTQKRGHSTFSALIIHLSALCCGVLIAAPAWLSLWGYLQESPILADRVAEHSTGGRGAKPRWADLPCLVSPFIYGSERQGDANIHKSVGAGNANEAATGFVGLCGLIFIAATIFPSQLENRSQVITSKWLIGIYLACFFIGYRLPPLVWLWPHLPILNAIDPRRFLVGMAISGVMLAGIGLDRMACDQVSRKFPLWLKRSLIIIAGLHLVGAMLPQIFISRIEAKAVSHYEKSVEPGPEKELIVAQRVKSQIHAITHAWPAYMAGRAVFCLLVVLIIAGAGSSSKRLTASFAILWLIELTHFGWGYNPHSERRWLDAIMQSQLHKQLTSIASTDALRGLETRLLATAEALPPNQLMSLGLKDLRNYDSIELNASLKPLEPLIQKRKSGDRTSRIDIGWKDVATISDLLKNAGVSGVIGRTKPPEGLFSQVSEILPGLWLGRWPGVPRIEGEVDQMIRDEPGTLELRIKRGTGGGSLFFRESFARGWSATAEDGTGLEIVMDEKTGFIRINYPAALAGQRIKARYRPFQWNLSLFLSAFGLMVSVAIVPAGSALFKKNQRDFSITSLSR